MKSSDKDTSYHHVLWLKCMNDRTRLTYMLTWPTTLSDIEVSISYNVYWWGDCGLEIWYTIYQLLISGYAAQLAWMQLPPGRKRNIIFPMRLPYGPSWGMKPTWVCVCGEIDRHYSFTISSIRNTTQRPNLHYTGHTSTRRGRCSQAFTLIWQIFGLRNMWDRKSVV